MTKSPFLRRLILLIVTTLLLSTILTSILYLTFSRKIFSQIKSRELVPQSQTVAQLMLFYKKGILPKGILDQLLDVNAPSWESYILMLDSDGTILYTTNKINNNDYTKDFVTRFTPQIKSTLSGNEVNYVGKLSNTGEEMLVIGAPVVFDNQVLGAVFLSKPLLEVSAATNSLSIALFYSFLIMLPLMILLSYWASYRLVIPLNHMSNVAMSMASGDFTVRASEVGKGEIGQLGQSLNFLSSELSKNISALVLERNRLLQTINGITEGIIAIDLEGNITHANPAVYTLFNQFAYDPNNTDKLQVIPDYSIWEDFSSVIEENYEITRNIKIGDTILLIIITPLVNDNGQIAGAVGLFRDITESEKLEQTRRDYVANVSHELRTPLTALRGLVEPLRDGLVTNEDDKVRYYDIILRETLRLSRLIDDLLELSRLQSGSLSLKRSSFDFSEMLYEVASKYSSVFEEKSIHFTTDFPDSLTVYSNPDRIEEVLTILLDNAYKFTPANGNIALTASIRDDKAYVSVKDNGVGIPKEDLPHIFERFYKSDKSRKSSGTGLGLSIAKEIMQQLNESIDVISEIDKGTEFTFTISLQ